jgi:hypothetical protein
MVARQPPRPWNHQETLTAGGQEEQEERTRGTAGKAEEAEVREKKKGRLRLSVG